MSTSTSEFAVEPEPVSKIASAASSAVFSALVATSQPGACRRATSPSRSAGQDGNLPATFAASVVAPRPVSVERCT